MKQNGWLIYNKKDAADNGSYINWFIEEAHHQNITLKLIIREDLTIGIISDQRTVHYQGEIIHLPEFAVVRTIDPFLSLHLESCGISVFNSSSISTICNNKALTHHYINNLEIPMVDTLFIKRNNVPPSPPLAFPFVIKDLEGRGGQNVYLIKSKRDWEENIAWLTANDCIIQSSNVDQGKDVRVFVVGREIVGAVLRESSNDFRANFKLGGSAKWYQLSNHELNIVHKIINKFDFDMVGIDFLIDYEGSLLFNEIEDVVGSRTLSAVSEVNILQKYVKHIKRKLSNKNIITH